MNSLTVAVFAVALAVASAGVITHSVEIPVAKSTVLQGPSTSTHVVGPDGSQIVASAPGGVINTVETGAESVVAYSAPVVAAPVAYSAPVAYAAPVAVPQISTTVVKSAPVAYAAAPVAYAAAPVAYAAGPALIASPLTASGYPVYAAGSGIEGQYVHDFTEKLYDDGTYKGEIFH